MALAPPSLALLVGGTDTAPPPETIDFSLGSVLWAVVLIVVAAFPLGMSLWALLDAARRPRWAWALSGRSQVVWMALIFAGLLSVIGGLFISTWYLVRVRTTIARIEDGRF